MNTDKVECIKCQHFAVTWNPQFPRCCKLYGFSSRELPSKEVYGATGEDCAGFFIKNTNRLNGGG